MATIYKTPGVFIEEIPKFPPSIAAVETAIPAFIGYTEKADNISQGDLLNKPKKIGSLVEYEFYFGYNPKPTITEVKLDDNNNYLSTSMRDNCYMYNSLRLFYANGGGDCYIVSVGFYGASKSDTHFTAPGAGLNAIQLVDEPTILLFPDAVLLSNTSLYRVQQAALLQCQALMDRVALFDLKFHDAKGDEFRSNIGVSSLKYSMAYTPWLKVALSKDVNYRDIKSVIRRGGSFVSLKNLTTESAIQSSIDTLENVISDVDNVTARHNALKGTEVSLRTKFNSLVSGYQNAPTPLTFTAINSFLFAIALDVNTLGTAASGALIDSVLKNNVLATISSDFKNSFSQLIAIEKEATAAGTGITGYTSIHNTAPYNTFSLTEWAGIFTTAIPSASTLISGTTVIERMDSVLDNISAEFDRVNIAFLRNVISATSKREKDLNDGLREQFPLFKSILSGINDTETNLPPSGAVAGVYALVDRERGVWKAPANVSLNGVIAPATVFSASELEQLNIDTGGKSINAIRFFTGKGTLIWGARTLAGNDNEWRYISVRRFFNFVEESVKKATEQFVFEPNDANTWVKVQAMIENFLTVLWRQGALQGVKPEHAFYVSVGLGKTMTPLDILEGRMIIEIGMAAVRPAEFIILKFSHKMAQS